MKYLLKSQLSTDTDIDTNTNVHISASLVYSTTWHDHDVCNAMADRGWGIWGNPPPPPPVLLGRIASYSYHFDNAS